MESISRGDTNPDLINHSNDGYEDFMRARREGLRGRYVVLHPYTREHVDAVDYQEEIDARKAAGFEGYDFWSRQLPEVDN